MAKPSLILLHADDLFFKTNLFEHPFEKLILLQSYINGVLHKTAMLLSI